MITHRNACWTVASLVRTLGHGIEGKRFISYLPMAHIAERMASHYIHVEQGTEITTCSNPARVGEYLREVRPQVFFAVPRVWEKARSTIEALVASDPDRQEVLVDAIELGRAAVARGSPASRSPPTSGRAGRKPRRRCSRWSGCSSAWTSARSR